MTRHKYHFCVCEGKGDVSEEFDMKGDILYK